MHQHDTDVQRTQHGNVQKNVGEVLIRNDDSIHRNNENLFPELRDVLKNPAEVCQLHGSTLSAILWPAATFKIGDSSTLHPNGDFSVTPGNV
jgi:hypothetical protein